jgi:hypothetical protein
MMSRILLSIILALSGTRAAAFLPQRPFQPPGWVSTSLASSEGNADDEFYRDLENAKKEKMGMDIPKEQAAEAARDLENEFLKAMQETRTEFEEAKDELGSDGAIDLLLGKIQKEDEIREEERKEFENNPDGADPEFDSEFE